MDESDHAHDVIGSPHERMRRILARHLCGWITGHRVSDDQQFLFDADLIMREAHEAGIRFHLALADGSVNLADGFTDFAVR